MSVHLSGFNDPALQRKVLYLRCACLALWLLVTLLPVVLARTPMTLGPWPLDFWIAAQGSVLVYLLIVVVYAALVNRWERQAEQKAPQPHTLDPQAATAAHAQEG